MKKVSLLLSVVALLGNVALAADTPPKHGKMPEPTKEQRQKMADLHEKMAKCLKSDSSMADCHKEMMQGCKDTMGKDGCPMMGHHGMHHDMKDHEHEER
jgi:hypothetical protein